jgi:hypothetical protein
MDMMEDFDNSFTKKNIDTKQSNIQQKLPDTQNNCRLKNMMERISKLEKSSKKMKIEIDSEQIFLTEPH